MEGENINQNHRRSINYRTNRNTKTTEENVDKSHDKKHIYEEIPHTDEKSLKEIENASIPNKRLSEGIPTPPPRKQSVSKDASIPNKRLSEGIPTPLPRKQSVSKDDSTQEISSRSYSNVSARAVPCYGETSMGPLRKISINPHIAPLPFTSGGLQGSSSIYGLYHRPIQRGTLERQSFGQLVQQDNDHVKLREVVSNGDYCMPDPALDKYFPLEEITGFTQSGGRFVQEDNVYGRQDGRNDYPYYSSIIQDIRPLSDKSTHFEKSHNFIAILQEGKLACENGLFFPGTYNDSITIAKNGKTEVSLAYHKMLGWVAVKKIPHEYNTGYHRLDVGIGHRHPNISIFFNRFKIKTHLYIVMELHDFNLSEYLKKYRDLPFHHRCRLVLEMFEGLKFLHGRNIIHRDIKPENLLINTDKVLRIADFGISRCTDKNEHHRTVHIGAKLWVPPILNDTQNEVDIHEKNDIYAAALVVFFIFKLEYPFLARIDDKFTLTYLIESKEKLSFRHELNDPFLQENVRCILSMYEDISAAKAIEMLHNSHRVKEISYEGSNQIFERSSGKRIALLVKSEHFSLEDVYKLDEPLKACDYEVIQTECNFLTLVQNLKNKATQLKSKEIHVFVYLSCHTYWNAYDQETVLEFDDGKKKGLTDFLSEIESAFKENYEKIINVIAVINGFRLYQNKSEKLIPVSLRGNFLVFFPSPSVELKMTLTNTPGLLPFHKFIKPATKLKDIWTAVEKREGVPFQIDCYKPVFDCFGKNGKKLFDFVF